jgi:hypothetical protein
MPDTVCEEALVKSRHGRALEWRGIIDSFLRSKHSDIGLEGGPKMVQQEEILLLIPLPAVYEDNPSRGVPNFIIIIL